MYENWYAIQDAWVLIPRNVYNHCSQVYPQLLYFIPFNAQAFPFTPRYLHAF